ncbi:MAG: hypothetical protein AAFY57_04325 [Cyanobacteria bacterium J06642_2]
MQTLKLNLFADYFQFYIQDDNEIFGDLSDAWSDDAVENFMAIGDRSVGIRTVRNMDVPVFIKISDEHPDLNPPDGSRVNRCTIECDAGSLVVTGCID